MKSRFKIVAMVTVVAVLCVATVALATDFTWDANTANTSWLTPTNWDQDLEYPDDGTDNATIDAAGFLCTFDPASDVTIKDLTLAGASPTQRKLHIKTAALTVANFDFDNYGELDVDKNFTVTTDTTLESNLWVDVADSTTADLGAASVDGIIAHLHLTMGTGSSFDVSTLRMDANSVDQTRILRFTGGEMDISNSLFLFSDTAPASTAYAALIIVSGTITAFNVDLQGGDAAPAAVQLDLDDDLIATDHTDMEGEIKVDVEAGTLFDTGRLTIETGASLTVTASGTGTAGKVQSSQPD